MRPDPFEDAPAPQPERRDIPGGPVHERHGDSVGARLGRIGKTVIVGIFAAVGLVAVIDMALTVADPSRPMQVAHLVFGDLARVAGLIFGAL